jgi:hypothetical protein
VAADVRAALERLGSVLARSPARRSAGAALTIDLGDVRG